MIEQPRVGFVLEQTLGHVTHAENIAAVVADDESVEAVLLPIPFEAGGLAARIPGYGNWTVRSGWRARRALMRAHRRDDPFEALLFHTQVPAVMNLDWLRRVPSVISIDATPLQYDLLGEHYDHRTGSERVESLKRRANLAAFDRAVHVVAFSQWARQGLIDDFGVAPDKVDVIPGGVDTSLWRRPDDPNTLHRNGRVVRILFVGGDLARKGGLDLIDAFRSVRVNLTEDDPRVELHLVTRSEVPEEEGVVVHRSMNSNSPELIALYHAADVFCLPTRGDCLPWVYLEAGAAGLPLVGTDVGAISEVVRDDDTGVIVPARDPASLAIALRRLVVDSELRSRLGNNARALIERNYDAKTNVGRLVTLLCDAAQQASPRARRSG